MSKRILSIALALAVMLVSLPLLPINIGGVSAGATAAPGDMSLEMLEWPTWADDVVIHDFDGLTTDSSQTNDNGTVYTGVGNGVSGYTNNTVTGLGYRDQYAAIASRAGNTLSLENGVLSDTLSQSAWFEFSIHMSTVAGLEYGRQFPQAPRFASRFSSTFLPVTLPVGLHTLSPA